jgi:polysaccharide biosynthesis protein PslG
MITRRHFLQGTAGAAAAVTILSNRIFAADAGGAIGLHVTGRLKPLHSKAIKASPLSIGFETLDRRQFDPTRTYEHLGKLGVKWARAQTGWCRCETVKGRYDFRWLDEVADGLLAQGIEPWFSLSYGNQFYTTEARNVSAVGFCPMFTAEARDGWAHFVDAISSHFAGRVKAWEIWNEPNTDTFWRPGKANAAAYVELAKFTAPLVRRRIPDAKIVGLALAGCNEEFLEEALKAGLTDFVDRISFHPYGGVPEHSEAFVAKARQLLGDRCEKIKLWQGECGAQSDPASVGGADKNKKKVSEISQARWLLRRILTDLRDDLELTSYFTTVDLSHYNWGDGPTDYDQTMGVLRGSDYSPKPSYYAYQSLCSMFDAQTKLNGHLEVAPNGAADRRLKTAGFVRNGRALYSYWLATDLLDAITPGTISLRLPTPAHATIERPVLIDPLSQRVYDLKCTAKADGLALSDVPLFNYPLIITDRTVVPLS